jgi:hypothetical protein
MVRPLRRIEDLTNDLELVERPVEFDQLVLEWYHMRDDKDQASVTVREAMSRAGHEDVQIALDAGGLTIMSPTELVDSMIEHDPRPQPIATISYRQSEQEPYPDDAVDLEITQAIPVQAIAVPAEVHHDHYADLAPDVLDREFATGQIPKVPSEPSPDDTAVIDDPDAVTSFDAVTDEQPAQPRSGPQPMLYMPAPDEEDD